MLEAAPDFNAAVLDFLAEVSRTGADAGAATG
jgi:hypothetical protein